MVTGSLATLLATMAMPVPICPEPTTPKDLTDDSANRDLNSIIQSFLCYNYANGDFFMNTIIINAEQSTYLLLHLSAHWALSRTNQPFLYAAWMEQMIAL